MSDPAQRGFAFDLALCALLLAVGVSLTTSSSAPQGAGTGTALDALLVPAVVLPILLRRRAPLAAAAALAAGCVVSELPTFDQFRIPVVIPVALLIVYALGRWASPRSCVAGLGLVAASSIFLALTDPVVRDDGGVLGTIGFLAPLCALIWASGRLVRSGDVLAGRLAERSRSLMLQREQTARLAVEVERTQLASDLDSAARDRVREMIKLSDDGARSPAVDAATAPVIFARIERLGRESLNEMRGLLGVLRSDERGARSPIPTLAQLERLLADARAGGRVVELAVDGDRRPLPGGVELAAYRVVQHALVAVRGDHEDTARVRLRYMPGALELCVDGPPAAGGSADAALAAARERVATQGGTFSAVRSPSGRRRLEARLPVVAADG